MRGMARELACQGISVNSIAPGIFRVGTAKRQWDNGFNTAFLFMYWVAVSIPQLAAAMCELDELAAPQKSLSVGGGSRWLR